MGAKIEYRCEKCDFKIINNDLNYFVDEETNCVVEHATGKLTFDMGHGSKIKGRIIPSFCPDCSSKVHFYYNENKSYVKEIKLDLERDEEDFREVLDKKYKFRRIGSELKGVIESKDKTHGKCPKCGKNIPLIAEGGKCPKCSGELHGFLIALYD